MHLQFEFIILHVGRILASTIPLTQQRPCAPLQLVHAASNNAVEAALLEFVDRITTQPLNFFTMIMSPTQS